MNVCLAVAINIMDASVLYVLTMLIEADKRHIVEWYQYFMEFMHNMVLSLQYCI